MELEKRCRHLIRDFKALMKENRLIPVQVNSSKGERFGPESEGRLNEASISNYHHSESHFSINMGGADETATKTTTHSHHHRNTSQVRMREEDIEDYLKFLDLYNKVFGQLSVG